jgi:hypothetical protein
VLILSLIISPAAIARSDRIARQNFDVQTLCPVEMTSARDRATGGGVAFEYCLSASGGRIEAGLETARRSIPRRLVLD